MPLKHENIHMEVEVSICLWANSQPYLKRLKKNKKVKQLYNAPARTEAPSLTKLILGASGLRRLGSFFSCF